MSARNRDHVMIDIETMSTSNKASILTIGAVVFDPNGNDNEDSLKENSFYTLISLEDNQKEGRDIDAGTVIWWMKQTKEAQEALYNDTPKTLRAGLTEFKTWAGSLNPKPNIVWANSPSFDCVILKDAFAQCSIFWPFKFFEERDVRTIKDLAYPEGWDVPQFGTGVAHNALDDAIKQAMLVQNCMHKLQGRAA